MDLRTLVGCSARSRVSTPNEVSEMLNAVAFMLEPLADLQNQERNRSPPHRGASIKVATAENETQEMASNADRWFHE